MSLMRVLYEWRTACLSILALRARSGLNASPHHRPHRGAVCGVATASGFGYGRLMPVLWCWRGAMACGGGCGWMAG